jgi:hypothetical protein
MIVPNSLEMNSATFRKHLEARHIPVGDFSDLKHFFQSDSMFSRDRDVLEAYHRHLHRRYDYNHEHQE